MDTNAINNRTNKKNKVTLKKKSTGIDLTPMADIGFLLISFFVFTTTLSQPVAMNLIMPNDRLIIEDEIPQSAALTLLLDKNNCIYYYAGMLTSGVTLYKSDYSASGIRNVIIQKKKQLSSLKGKSASDLVLIIKPLKGSSFKNFVDIIDEVTINDVKHYYTAEPDKSDSTLLSNNFHGN